MGAFVSLALLSATRFGQIERLVEDVGALMGTLDELQREVCALKEMQMAREQASQVLGDMAAIGS